MDEIDRAIINGLQGGFPVCERPFAAAGEALGITEADLIERLRRLSAEGVISRFGPMWHAEKMGGGLSLCAMQVPPERFDEVALVVNGFPEVAHNYAREHTLNMWFVLATEKRQRIAEVLTAIEFETGIPVYDMPKIEEFFVGLRFEA